MKIGWSHYVSQQLLDSINNLLLAPLHRLRSGICLLRCKSFNVAVEPLDCVRTSSLISWPNAGSTESLLISTGEDKRGRCIVREISLANIRTEWIQFPQVFSKGQTVRNFLNNPAGVRTCVSVKNEEATHGGIKKHFFSLGSQRSSLTFVQSVRVKLCHKCRSEMRATRSNEKLFLALLHVRSTLVHVD